MAGGAALTAATVDTRLHPHYRNWVHVELPFPVFLNKQHCPPTYASSLGDLPHSPSVDFDKYPSGYPRSREDNMLRLGVVTGTRSFDPFSEDMYLSGINSRV